MGEALFLGRGHPVKVGIWLWEGGDRDRGFKVGDGEGEEGQGPLITTSKSAEQENWSECSQHFTSRVVWYYLNFFMIFFLKSFKQIKKNLEMTNFWIPTSVVKKFTLRMQVYFWIFVRGQSSRYWTFKPN